MISSVVLLLALGALLAHANREDEARLLDRLDLKNYKKFAKERESTSTDSTDSSSDAKRIALAVEAALKEAELADKFTPAPSSTSDGSKPFRLRLSTTNKARTCATYDCNNVNATSVSIADINSASVTVVTTNGTFTGTFNATGVAVNRNDLFQFRVVFSTPLAGIGRFDLSTTQNQFGVNVTSITIQSQGVQRPNGGRLIYFDPLGGDASGNFWNAATNRSRANSDITIQNVTSTPQIIGCSATFDGPNPVLDGITVFTVFNTTANSTLVTNTNATSFGFNVRFFTLNATAERSPVDANLGFLPLPCGTRGRVIYDEIAIVTERENGIGFGDDTLEHPLIYDVLKSATQSAAPSFDNFIRELQLAAGRTQLRLESITLDRGAFSDLSHSSKFTPCFRIYPRDDAKIEVFIGMRSASGGGLVRSVLRNAPPRQFVDNGVVKSFEDLQATGLPQFQTTEIVFSSLGLPLSNAEVEGTDQRPFIQLDSDVTVQLEACPTFSYFS